MSSADSSNGTRVWVSHGRGHPASLLLVHGAGSGPWIFDPWPASFPNLDVRAIDLHEHLDISRASMNDYADRLVEAATELPAPVSICGWSMGGLVAMLAASRLPIAPHSLILIESSPPGEIQGFQPEQELESRSGTFNPQSVYGAFPAGLHARPESLLARAERKRGISVPSLPCPSLVVYGDDFPDDRGRRLARLYGSEIRSFPGLDHWDLVFDGCVREAIRDFHARRSRLQTGDAAALVSRSE
jgi:pimeloyl-ACP methyl ester carboxylesterase